MSEINIDHENFILNLTKYIESIGSAFSQNIDKTSIQNLLKNIFPTTIKKNAELLILVGSPGSGKSHSITDDQKQHFAFISQDDIMEKTLLHYRQLCINLDRTKKDDKYFMIKQSILFNEIYQNEKKNILQFINGIIVYALREKINLIIESTGISFEYISFLIKSAQKNQYDDKNIKIMFIICDYKTLKQNTFNRFKKETERQINLDFLKQSMLQSLTQFEIFIRDNPTIHYSIKKCGLPLIDIHIDNICTQSENGTLFYVPRCFIQPTMLYKIITICSHNLLTSQHINNNLLSIDENKNSLRLNEMVAIVDGGEYKNENYFDHYNLLNKMIKIIKEIHKFDSEKLFKNFNNDKKIPDYDKLYTELSEINTKLNNTNSFAENVNKVFTKHYQTNINFFSNDEQVYLYSVQQKNKQLIQYYKYINIELPDIFCFQEVEWPLDLLLQIKTLNQDYSIVTLTNLWDINQFNDNELTEFPSIEMINKKFLQIGNKFVSCFYNKPKKIHKNDHNVIIYNSKKIQQEDAFPFYMRMKNNTEFDDKLKPATVCIFSHIIDKSVKFCVVNIHHPGGKEKTQANTPLDVNSLIDFLNKKGISLDNTIVCGDFNEQLENLEEIKNTTAQLEKIEQELIDTNTQLQKFQSFGDDIDLQLKEVGQINTDTQVKYFEEVKQLEKKKIDLELILKHQTYTNIYNLIQFINKSFLEQYYTLMDDRDKGSFMADAYNMNCKIISHFVAGNKFNIIDHKVYNDLNIAVDLMTLLGLSYKPKNVIYQTEGYIPLSDHFPVFSRFLYKI